MASYEFACVWKESKATGSALLVHLALADCAVNGLARTSHKMLAHLSRLSINSVGRAINQLAETREIEILTQKSGNRLPQIDVMPHRGRSSELRRATPQTGDMDQPSATPQTGAMENKDLSNSICTNDVSNGYPTPQNGNTDAPSFDIAQLTNLNISVPIAKPEDTGLAQVFAAIDLQPYASSSQIPSNLVVPADVGRVLAAAGVPPNDEVPLYWFRAEHLADLTDLCKGLGITVDNCIERITKSGQKAPALRRITDLEPLVRG